MDTKVEGVREALGGYALTEEFAHRRRTSLSRGALRRWSAEDFAAALIVFSIGLATNLATVLNNAYSFGSTLYDSAIFQTVIWRSGWALLPAPAIGDTSFLNIHFSPIQYLPNAVSYLIPIDRMSYFGLVYGIVYGFLTVVAFRAFWLLSGGRTWLAALGSLGFYLAGPVNSGQWEPHQEIASALFMAAFFLAWAQSKWRSAALFLLLNATVREDCGMLLALPLFLLALHEGWMRRRMARTPPPSHALGYAFLSAALSVAFWTVKRLSFNGVDTVAVYYYGAEPFAHLSLSLLTERLSFTLLHGQYLWMPGVVLLAAAYWLREPRLAIGWVAFFPYWLFNFLSKGDLHAHLGSYKAFPLILTMVWPAILALTSEPAQRRAFGWVQTFVLAAAILSFEDGTVRLAPPLGMAGLVERWSLHPETERADLYRMFESRLASGDLGATRASQGALALYPYSFPRWDRSQLTSAPEEEAERVDSVLWFEGDRDEETTRRWLQRGHFPYRYAVIGTRLVIATRKPPAALSAVIGALQLLPPR